ncbi:MAG: hypothetical protein IPG53_20735 [Ignavibacteriales bacterium]|nr:hypothetical protein [Ignavibacteriales bacterium]
MKKLISKGSYSPFVGELISIEVSRLLKRSCMIENTKDSADPISRD